MANEMVRGCIRVNTLVLDDFYNDKFGKRMYCNLWDICAPTKEELEYITTSLEKQEIFNFNNTGKYVGKDRRTRLEYTFDDGRDNFVWLLKLGKLLKSKKELGKYDVKIKLNRSLILTNGIYYLPSETRLSIDEANKVIDLFMYKVRSMFKDYGLESVLDDKLVGKKHEDIFECMSEGYYFLRKREVKEDETK